MAAPAVKCDVPEGLCGSLHAEAAGQFIVRENVVAAGACEGEDRSSPLFMGASPQTPTAASRTLPSLPIREAGGTPNGRGSSIRAVARSLRSRQKPRDPAMNLSCWR